MLKVIYDTSQMPWVLANNVCLLGTQPFQQPFQQPLQQPLQQTLLQPLLQTNRQQEKRKADSEGMFKILIITKGYFTYILVLDFTTSPKRRRTNNSNDNQQQATSQIEDNSLFQISEYPNMEDAGYNLPAANQPLSLPQTYGISINPAQLQYARSLQSNNMALPLNTKQQPCWPDWTLNTDE